MDTDSGVSLPFYENKLNDNEFFFCSQLCMKNVHKKNILILKLEKWRKECKEENAGYEGKKNKNKFHVPERLMLLVFLCFYFALLFQITFY